MPHTTILYVEDNQLVRRVVRELLESEGWRVEVCEDGSAGMAKIESGRPYDLLLMDCELPGASGLELARRARSLAHRRHTPVVIISGGEVETAARRAGADAFLRKPDDTAAIVETISQLLVTAGASTRGSFG